MPLSLSGRTGRKGERGKDGNCTCAEVTDDTGIGHFSAFSVARHDSLQSTDGDEIISWDHVFVNAIGDFDPSSGIFTCCIPGKTISQCSVVHYSTLHYTAKYRTVQYSTI